jgi:hypothetical protein
MKRSVFVSGLILALMLVWSSAISSRGQQSQDGAGQTKTVEQLNLISLKPGQINVDAPLLPTVASVRCRDGLIEVSFNDKPSEWVKTSTRSCGSVVTPPPEQKWVCDVSCVDSHGCSWCCRGHYTKGDIRRFERKRP